MQRVRVELVGRSALLLHNVQLADPDNETVRAIADISSKRKKSEEDRKNMSRLEWYGGLYLAPGIDGPAMPTANLRKTFIEGGKITRQGTQVERALSFENMHVPLAYEGPRDIDLLWDSGEHVSRLVVNVQRNKIVRTRPQFLEWAVVAIGYLQEDVMSVADLAAIASTAGRSVGLCDNRRNGYGRFTANIVEESSDL